MHKDIREHIEILSNYFASVREMFELVHNEPEDDFEKNYRYVRFMELEVRIEHLAEDIGESVKEISKIQPNLDK